MINNPERYLISGSEILGEVVSASDYDAVVKERDRWKRRAERFREGYRDAQAEVVGLKIHEMQLQADGNASATIRREADRARTKLLAVCVERNEAREQLTALTAQLAAAEAERDALIAAAKNVPEPEDEGFCEPCGDRLPLTEHMMPGGFVAYRWQHKPGCWFGDLRAILDKQTI